MLKQAGFRFSPDYYITLDMDNMTLTKEEEGQETEYIIGEGIETKLLYTNPNTTTEMTTETMFLESEIEGYQYLVFTITDTTGAYEVKEWCEIEPLKRQSGQFAISMPINGGLYVRKVYRSNGNVKPSAGVYSIGTTTEDRTACIIKTVEAVKGV